MNRQEFSNQFDVLFNNITSNQAPGLNEYEKSVFLTKAQDEMIKNYFNPKSNKVQEGFDGNAKRQTDFSMLMKTYKEVINSTYLNANPDELLDPRAVLISSPDDLFIAINETITDSTRKKIRQVIPLSFSEYTRLMSKPYKEPLKFQSWRLITNTKQSKSISNLILNASDRKLINNSLTYILRYIKRPIPIILENLTDAFGEELSIGGYKGSEAVYNNNKCCELDPSMHEEILQRAVELAKVAWVNDLSASIQVGQRSE